MDCSRRTTYFASRIVFHTRIASGAQRFTTWESFFYMTNYSSRTAYFRLRVVCLRYELFQASTKIFPLKDRFSKMNCYRRAKIFHLRIGLSEILHDELFQAHHVFPFEGCFSIIGSSTKRFTAPRKVFHLRIVFPKDALLQAQHVFYLRVAFQMTMMNCSRRTNISHLRIVGSEKLFQAWTTYSRILSRNVFLRD